MKMNSSNSKKRLLEVMGRLDKSFKPKLNEDFEMGTDDNAPEIGAEVPAEAEEKTPEEKLQELTAKVDELYALLHGETEGEKEEVPAEEMGAESLQEWNFDKKKGEKETKEDDKKDSKEHEESETPAEEKAEHKVDETSTVKKVPVAAIAKVGN